MFITDIREMAKKKFYAVAAGNNTGIYQSWPECEARVKGVKGARYKGFASHKEAEKWLADGGIYERNPGKVKQKAKASVDDSMTADGKLMVYTDGSSLNNPGPGGWAAVILEQDDPRELFGAFRKTTNNRMELLACIRALEALKGVSQPCLLHTDSSYVVNGIEKGWARSWRKRGWRKSDGNAALNSDLWAQLLDLVDEVPVTFKWVKGHAGNEYNELCDRLAVAAAKDHPTAVDEGYETV